MSHTIKDKTPIPYSSEQCAHYIDGTRRKAFDTIPVDIIFDAERHNKTIDDQKANMSSWPQHLINSSVNL